LCRYEQVLKELKSAVDTGSLGEGEGDGDAVGEVVLSCKLNLAACAQKLGEHPVALKLLNEVLGVDPSHPKALYRRGQTYMHLSEWEAAREDYRKMAALGSAELKLEAGTHLAKIDRLEREALSQQKKQFQGFFNR